MAFRFVRNDITKMTTDIVVTVADTMPAVGPNVAESIYKEAGYNELLAARNEIGNIPLGEVAPTPAFNLRAKYIFHTAVLGALGYDDSDEAVLRKCYKNCLTLAYNLEARSIAFPLIPAGDWRYAKEEGLRIAFDEIKDFLNNHDMDVYVVTDDNHLNTSRQSITQELDAYIGIHYVDEDNLKQDINSVLCEPQSPVMGESIIPKMSAPQSPVMNAQKTPMMSAPQTSRISAPQSPMMSMDMATPYASCAPEPIKVEEKAPKKKGLLSIITGVKSGKKDNSPKSETKLTAAKIAKPETKPTDAKIVETEDTFSDGMSYSTIQASFCEEEPVFVFDDKYENALNERMKHASDSFSDYLLYLINSKGMTNSDVYKAALVNKKTFSKIKNNPEYHPNKMTAMCLCVGAKLNLDETKDLLARAGYALSPCDKTDIIFSFFIEHMVYDIFEIDIQLEEHGLAPLVDEDF